MIGLIFRERDHPKAYGGDEERRQLNRAQLKPQSSRAFRETVTCSRLYPLRSDIRDHTLQKNRFHINGPAKSLNK